MYKIYPASNTFVDKPEKIIVEDTNSGYEFFKSVANEHGITCESAGGKTKLFSKLLDCDGKRICIVADGAAIGPEVDALYKTALKNSKGRIPGAVKKGNLWLIPENAEKPEDLRKKDN